MFHSPGTSSIYGFARWLPVSTALVVLAACATSSPRESTRAAERSGYDSPEEALEEFAGAWNSGELNAVVETFAPARRATIREASPPLSDWRVKSGFVQPQCHPRGAFWKTAVVRLHADGAEHDEVVWLRAVDGEWWMYAL